MQLVQILQDNLPTRYQVTQFNFMIYNTAGSDAGLIGSLTHTRA